MRETKAVEEINVLEKRILDIIEGSYESEDHRKVQALKTSLGEGKIVNRETHQEHK